MRESLSLVAAADTSNPRLQVQPPVAADEAACASSYLWWQQRLAGSSKLWDVVREAHSHITAQMQAQGGLMFWQRVQAEIYSPPYTVGPGLDSEGRC